MTIHQWWSLIEQTPASCPQSPADVCSSTASLYLRASLGGQRSVSAASSFVFQLLLLSTTTSLPSNELCSPTPTPTPPAPSEEACKTLLTFKTVPAFYGSKKNNQSVLFQSAIQSPFYPPPVRFLTSMWIQTYF